MMIRTRHPAPRRTRCLGALVVTLALAAVAARAGAAADNGTVSASVTVPGAAAACIQLSTTSVSFGTLALGATGDGTPNVVVTNCSTATETILAAGTNATGSNAGVSWTLSAALGSAGTCPPLGTLGTNQYHLDIDSGARGAWRLGLMPQTLHAMAAGEQATHTMHIVTACPGSTGQGETMSMQINYTATL